MDDLKKAYPIKHYLVGGHSQGGFLTYSILMNSPEAIAGAFPISAGVIFQCEPSAYEDKALKEAQRTVPLAIVHGKNDGIVPFDSGSYASGLFLDASWPSPSVRLFTSDDAAHMFGRLPVGPAIRWLESLASDNPKVLLDFAEARLKESARRDAIAALRKLKELKLDVQAKARFDKLVKDIDSQAAPKGKMFLTAIKENKDNKWVDGFLAFRDEFEYAEAAEVAMAAFNALRAEHETPAKKAMNEARQSFQKQKRDEGYAKAGEVVDRYYASTHYRLAKKWLDERK